ncbi:MAG: hypothetical protein V7720_06445 [Halioglobus sp.]
MKLAPKILFFMSITVLVAGCKLAVIVVEGGEVQSDQSGTCVAGAICLVEVIDTNFSDAFVPIPNDAWYFDSWNSGAGFFCGGNIDPVCSLSFGKHRDNEALQEIVESPDMFYLMPIFKEIEPNIIVVEGRTIRAEGKEWLQPADFVQYSYKDISALCPDKVCSGILLIGLPGTGLQVDISGYFWATSDEVRMLFQTYRKAGRPILQDFDPTRLATDIGEHLVAMLSDQSGVVVFGGGDDPVAEIHIFLPNDPDNPDFSSDDVGPWLWRPVE